MWFKVDKLKQRRITGIKEQVQLLLHLRKTPWHVQGIEVIWWRQMASATRPYVCLHAPWVPGLVCKTLHGLSVLSESGYGCTKIISNPRAKYGSLDFPMVPMGILYLICYSQTYELKSLSFSFKIKFLVITYSKLPLCSFSWMFRCW
jgi:hypothetical protein